MGITPKQHEYLLYLDKPAKLTVHGGRAALELRSKTWRCKPQGATPDSEAVVRFTIRLPSDDG
ncbi:MAG: hypothetical protein LBD49_01915 [Oscillospiraceae bacterium]|jgi:hypothetical protein|nr:hypothetical protein [Oscillospiraceae bacterium]